MSKTSSFALLASFPFTLQINLLVCWMWKETSGYPVCVFETERIQNNLQAASLTVHFKDLIQVREDGSQLSGSQELLSLQRPGENHLQDT